MQTSTPPTRPSFSLFELNQHLRRVLSFNLREPIWIRAEVADISTSRGNYYISLVERDAFQTKAKADAAIWNSEALKLRTALGDETFSAALQTGQQLLLNVQVEYHEYYGLKLSIRDIDVSYTLGQMEQQRLEIWKRLQNEHLHDLNAQLTLPLVPQRIAIISTKEAAGYQDFIQQLKNNSFGYQFECTLFEAAMQGVMVEKDVKNQIRLIESQQQHFDCVVIVRGGGAKLDLAAFDNFELCKAVATCELPILTGIGHDIDESLADRVAHTSLKTPTAVAEFLIHRVLAFESAAQQLAQQCQKLVQIHLQNAHIQLEQLEQKSQRSAANALQQRTFVLQQLEQKFQYIQPINMLQRGFALVFDEHGNRITSAQQAQQTNQFILKFADGELVLKK